jgi:hypothetical protein
MMLGRGSFASLQSTVSVLAGLVSISGAVYSAVRYVKPTPGTLDVLAVVRSETGDRPLSGSTVRIATRDDVPVAELTAPPDGHVRQPLHEGDYRLRVSAPSFQPQTRDVHLEAGTMTAVRFELAQAETSPTAGRGRVARTSDGGRPLSRGIGAAGQFLRRLGL